MTWPLRQSTAGQEIPLGPFVDSVDGDTGEGSLTIVNTDIKLFKSGATAEVSKNSGGATNITEGRYYAVLDATDTDTLGPMRVSVHMSGALNVWLDCVVYLAANYDALYSTTGIATTTSAAAIQAQTDQLAFCVANVLNCNVTHVNEIEVTGDGESGSEWGPI